MAMIHVLIVKYGNIALIPSSNGMYSETALTLACKIIAGNTLQEFKYNTVNIKVSPMVLIIYQKNGISTCVASSKKKRGVCQKVHIKPMIRLAKKGLYFFNSLGNANPLQPGSS